MPNESSAAGDIKVEVKSAASCSLGVVPLANAGFLQLAEERQSREAWLSDRCFSCTWTGRAG